MLCLATAAFLAACGLGTEPPDARGSPNVLLVLIDDLRTDALGATGHPVALTPHIDELAAEGALFTNAFVVSSLCSPSRATILTGAYPRVHGVRDNGTGINRSVPTIQALLTDAGYRTGFIGKWHMGSHGEPQADFHRWVSFRDQGEYLDPTLNVDGRVQQHAGHMTDILTDFALDFIREPDERPFFLVVSHKAVHEPFTAQERFRGLYDAAAFELPATASDSLEGKPDFLRDRQEPLPLGPHRNLVRRYFETLSGADDGVGTLLDELRGASILDSTLVIVMSDNGFFLGEHGFYDKRLAYEESIRIPIVARYPPWFAPGTRVETLALNVDILPTVAEVAGVGLPRHLTGISLSELAAGRSRTSFLYEYYQEERHPESPTTLTVRTVSHKLITYPDHPGVEELYDLDGDPLETTNLAERPEFAALRDSLWTELRRLDQSVGVPTLAAAVHEPGPGSHPQPQPDDPR